MRNSLTILIRSVPMLNLQTYSKSLRVFWQNPCGNEAPFEFAGVSRWNRSFSLTSPPGGHFVVSPFHQEILFFSFQRHLLASFIASSSRRWPRTLPSRSSASQKPHRPPSSTGSWTVSLCLRWTGEAVIFGVFFLWHRLGTLYSLALALNQSM